MWSTGFDSDVISPQIFRSSKNVGSANHLPPWTELGAPIASASNQSWLNRRSPAKFGKLGAPTLTLDEPDCANTLTLDEGSRRSLSKSKRTYADLQPNGSDAGQSCRSAGAFGCRLSVRICSRDSARSTRKCEPDQPYSGQIKQPSDFPPPHLIRSEWPNPGHTDCQSFCNHQCPSGNHRRLAWETGGSAKTSLLVLVRVAIMKVWAKILIILGSFSEINFRSHT